MLPVNTYTRKYTPTLYDSRRHLCVLMVFNNLFKLINFIIIIHQLMLMMMMCVYRPFGRYCCFSCCLLWLYMIYDCVYDMITEIFLFKFSTFSFILTLFLFFFLLPRIIFLFFCEFFFSFRKKKISPNLQLCYLSQFSNEFL